MDEMELLTVVVHLLYVDKLWNIVVAQELEKTQVGKPRRTRSYNIKADLKVIGREVANFIQLDQDRNQ
jgi:hypothetical protein